MKKTSFKPISMLKRSQNYFQIIILLIYLRMFSTLRMSVSTSTRQIIEIQFNISSLKIKDIFNAR